MKNKILILLLSFTYFICIGLSQFSYAVTEQEYINELQKAQKGNVDAQFNLGLWFYQGTEMQQDYNKALVMFQLAAEQGDAAAQLFLGSMYHKAEGVPQDYKKAIKWYRLSAAQGNAHAQKFLKLAEHQLKEKAEAELNGKVVVRITSTVPSYSLKSENDEFDELLGYNLSVGCKYTVEIENKTPYKVKLEGLVLETNHPDIPRGIWGSAIIAAKEVFDIGQKSEPRTNYGHKLEKRFELLPKVPSDEKKNKMIEKYGCDAQAGTLYLDAHPMHPIIATFARSTGIKDHSNEYIIGHSYGDYPLKKYVGGVSR